MAWCFDRKPQIIQALALGLVLVGFQPVSRALGDDEAPIRFGDPEVTWDERKDEAKPEPTVTPNAVTEPAPESTAAPIIEATHDSPNAFPYEPITNPTKPVSERVKELLQSIPGTTDYSPQFQEILQMGVEARPAVMDIFSDSTQQWQSRWAAAMLLGRMGGAESVQVLEKGLADSLFLIRLASATALGNAGDVNSAVVLRETLQDKAMVVRSAAVDSLAKLKDREAIPLLEKELWDSKNFLRNQGLSIRSHIFEALVALGGEDVRPIFKRLLKDNDLTLRKKACEQLGETVCTK